MWFNPPDNLVLSDNEVHIWRADFNLIAPFIGSYFQLLSSEEKDRAQKFRFDRDRETSISARGILRLLIGRYLEADPAEISFQYNEFGKPCIASIHSLHFNISHSRNMAVFAFTKRFSIGIDVEFVSPDVEVKQVAGSFFSNNEVAKLFALPEEQQTLGFFNCWTRKEAFIKAVGEGLSFPLDTFEVSLEPGKPAELMATDWDPTAVSKWSMYSMSPGPNFVGSVVIEGLIGEAKYWNWQMG